MTEETDGGPPPTSKNLTKESEEEESNQVVKDEDKEDQQESKQIEVDTDDDDDDDDGPPPGWQHSPSPPSSPPLLDMLMNEFPPCSSPLPPTPPIPSSPTDLNMEPQDSEEDDGPPPGWDKKYQLNEQLIKPAHVLLDSSDVRVADVQQNTHNVEGEPKSQAASDIQVEQEDSEDDGPPPGWDSKCQPEPKLQTSTTQSDIKMEDGQKDVANVGQPTSEVPLVDQQDSEDEGPPPGWNSKCQPKSNLQPECPPIHLLDIKMEDVKQARNENDPPSKSQSQSYSSPLPELVPSGIKVEEQDLEYDSPPGWDSKCQLEPKLQVARQTISPSGIMMEHLQEAAQNEDLPKSQVNAHSSPAPKLVTSVYIRESDTKVEEQNLEYGEPKSQMSCPATPPSDLKIGNGQQGEQGPPPGWGSTPSLPSDAKTGYEQNCVKFAEEIPQPRLRRQFDPPIKPQTSMPKPRMPIDSPEMGQMVCGSCRHLLSYPRGARYVECACCLEENYVLEEHEVGQVVCGGCNVLLMYPFGAPKVKCANCSAETEIGDQNRRPSLSEHQSRARRHFKRVPVR
ncbi:uncharacterized protein [Rutidosis leptorrhynchoides]|uniref:uncharacterized protein isoform X2 n=1 Tax=Rutidosis leptorrhynchoides TaxID=125765 RepID=UPI003A9A1C77